MAKARLHNDNVYPYKNEVKGLKVEIPAKSFIEMDFWDAHAVKSSFCEVRRDADGQQLPETYSMLRVEKLEEDKVVETGSETCNACGKTFTDQIQLVKHAMEEHPEQFHDKKAAAEGIKAVAKRGRPAKEAQL
jgi:hypothetical protein